MSSPMTDQAARIAAMLRRIAEWEDSLALWVGWRRDLEAAADLLQATGEPGTLAAVARISGCAAHARRGTGEGH